VARYERKDRFHQRAKREGYRSRAAYKLLELQRAQRLLRPGQRGVDLGCWPGGWLQVAAAAVGPSGRVVGLDRAPTQPLAATPQAVALQGDVSDPDALRAVREALGGAADAVLCDAAPKLSGVRARDRAEEEALLEAVEAALPVLLRPGGTLLVKILEGPEAQQAVRRLGARFERTRMLRPRASRRGTTERYLLAQGWRGERPAAPG
jgi:23S rRNA (uridine2552-2'-O)-methyltransferase